MEVGSERRMGTLRAIPAAMGEAAVRRVDGLLDAVRVEHRVALPLAVESGSRAWGFPSPDSDYDCRFVFVRSVADYLTPWPRRDVIEMPPDAEVDVNGWDLGKALALLVKGNAVIIEWLVSPIVYRGDEAFRGAFLNLARTVAARPLIGRHYLRLGQSKRALFGDAERRTPQKKIFYLLRAAAALRWLRLHPREAVAPMNFPELMAGCEPTAAVRAAVGELLERKAATRELGTAPVPEVLTAFADDELRWAGTAFDTGFVPVSPEARAAAEAFFRAWVVRLDPDR